MRFNTVKAGERVLASVSAENLVKEYGSRSKRVRALDGVSISARDGEFLVLVGPSGCGKTTTLRVIAGLESPEAGTVTIGDRVVNGIEPRDRNVAMVFQNYALYPHMTVYKNMAFGLKMRGTPKADIDRRVRAVADQLELTPLLDRQPGALSGGEQQRVALGRAIVREPHVFLFDEPLSNLDATLRTQLRSELKALHRRLGTTVIHVTHDQEEAMSLGDRIVVMRNGTVQQCGSPLEVYTSPVNRFVATFIGRPAMSLLRGRLEGTGGRITFVDAGEVRIDLAIAPNENVDNAVGSEILLGVRAEHVYVTGDLSGGAGGNSRIPATVSLTEPMGDRTYVHAITAGGERIVARVNAFDAAEPGAHLEFEVDPCGVCLLDRKSVV